MPADREPQPTHADRHDLDKLSRWKTALDAAPDSAPAESAEGAAPFPACAIFLVSPQDRAAHNIFRRYRTAFEELGAGFHHLVIFGQHGISTTATAFLAELDMEQANIPLLAIAPMNDTDDDTDDDAGGAHCLPLPKGEQDGELDARQPWGKTLTSIRAAAAAQSPLSLDGATGVSRIAFRRGSLTGAINAALRKLGGSAT